MRFESATIPFSARLVRTYGHPMDRLFFALTFAAALGTGLIAGVFFAFSTFVIQALVRLPSAQGLAAMQSINLAVINPWFLLPFLGASAACLSLGAGAIWQWSRPGSAWLLGGSLLYLIGTLGVTIACNVPRNEALAAIVATETGSVAVWLRYVQEWTFWNHVRTLAALMAAGCLTWAIWQQRGPG